MLTVGGCRVGGSGGCWPRSDSSFGLGVDVLGDGCCEFISVSCCSRGWSSVGVGPVSEVLV